MRSWSSLCLAFVVLVQAIWTPGHLYAEHHYEPALIAAEHEAAAVTGSAHVHGGERAHPHEFHAPHAHGDQDHGHGHGQAHSTGDRHRIHAGGHGAEGHDVEGHGSHDGRDHHEHDEHQHGAEALDHLLAVSRGDLDSTWTPVFSPCGLEVSLPCTYTLLIERARTQPPRDAAPGATGPRAPPLA